MNINNNTLFACDALTLMEHLPSDTVTLVYLDPPWNIRSDFNFGPGSSTNYSDESYSSLISKVIQQSHRVLTDNGSLVVHYSPHAKLDIRLLLNQVFGKKAEYEILWEKKTIQNMPKKGPKVDSDIILVYAKSDHPIYNPILRPLTPQETSRYALEDGKGPFFASDLTMPLVRSSNQFVWRNFNLEEGRSWRYSFDKLEKMVLEDKIYFPSGRGLPRIKRYLSENPGVEIGLTWSDIPSRLSREEQFKYPFQIPLILMERIIQLASFEGNRVLDPFCGSGTTLIAAQKLGRLWWGADDSNEATSITIGRLDAAFGLQSFIDYQVHSASDLAKIPINELVYREVLTDVDQIPELQQQISTMMDHFLSLKKRMNITQDNGENVEEAIQEMEHWITTSIANQVHSVDNYIENVRTWLIDWSKLEKASQSFLPQAELLYEHIGLTRAPDYSPFIIQYCRAFENELLVKLFAAFTDFIHDTIPDIAKFVSKDLEDNKTKQFADSLQKRRVEYTLGSMNFIMSMIKKGGRTLKRSAVLQEFRKFTIQYFGENIVEKSYLEQINKINKDYRCKAAHPHILDIEIAQRCRDAIRSCLNELIMNYDSQ